jgi:hypothetical protein
VLCIRVEDSLPRLHEFRSSVNDQLLTCTVFKDALVVFQSGRVVRFEIVKEVALFPFALRDNGPGVRETGIMVLFEIVRNGCCAALLYTTVEGDCEQRLDILWHGGHVRNQNIRYWSWSLVLFLLVRLLVILFGFFLSDFVRRWCCIGVG